VIAVVMGRDDVGDRLAGDVGRDPGVDRLRARFVERRLDDHDAGRLLDRERVVGAAAQVPHAGRQRLRVDRGLEAVERHPEAGERLVELAVPCAARGVGGDELGDAPVGNANCASSSGTAVATESRCSVCQTCPSSASTTSAGNATPPLAFCQPA